MPPQVFTYTSGDPQYGRPITLTYPCGNGDTVSITCYPESANETSESMKERFLALFDEAMDEHPWQ